jgi:hypothetical protein
MPEPLRKGHFRGTRLRSVRQAQRGARPSRAREIADVREETLERES